ncbi:MAG TPA: helix-turn-helix domain-containing protein [Solirubrobacteraceae bacterium]|jgi:Fur family ferric uptake transcriptional regulator|nr:helix-turn-helix domain-containing protein [Solirubrobacteraceae bacterium]
MTTSPDVPLQQASSLRDAIEVLRERGLRVSKPRRLLLGALFDADRPVSAEQLARRLALDAASVHRNLETLERNGLVRHVHLGHSPGLYAPARGGEREYICCERCGAATALEPEELDPVRRLIKQRYGYEPRFSHFPIVGVCAACAARGSERR